jgi:hypothetical protein
MSIFNNNSNLQSILTLQGLQEEEKKKELNDLKIKIDSLEKNKKGNTTRVSKRNEYNKSDLTAKQTALLIMYLREAGVFLKDASDKVILKCFEDATGFSAEQMKKLVSGHAKNNKAELSEKISDYDKLKALFKSMITKNEADKVKLSK